MTTRATKKVAGRFFIGGMTGKFRQLGQGLNKDEVDRSAANFAGGDHAAGCGEARLVETSTVPPERGWIGHWRARRR
jgi:hypothetical protein